MHAAWTKGAEEFLGMPFGHAARFEPPVDFKGRYKTDVLETKYFGHACECSTSRHFCSIDLAFRGLVPGMQVGDATNVTYGSEDCLFANIWFLPL